MRHDHDGDPELDRPRPRHDGKGTPARPAGGLVRAAAVALALVAVSAAGAPAGAAAQEGHGDHSDDRGDQDHHTGLHFTHPMIAESVSPDRKIRLDHQFFEFPDGDRENSGVLEAEFAVSRSFSVEAGIPFTYTESEFGNAEVLLKFANFAFEDAGLLLGYGLELGFPTNGTAGGEATEVEAAAARTPTSRRRSQPITARRSGADESAFPPVSRSSGGAGVEGTLGTDEWEVAPFLNVGWKSGPVELVGWSVFEIPFDQHEQSEVGTELAWSVSGLYHVSSRVQALLELDGSGGISGSPVGEDVVNVSPGLRVRVLPGTPLVLGSSVGFPLTSEERFDVRWKTSLFWHFPR